jgi:hypothetical protein
MTSGDRVTQLYTQALGTHFSRLLRHAWLQWDYPLIPATTRDHLVKYSDQIKLQSTANNLDKIITQKSRLRFGKFFLNYDQI